MPFRYFRANLLNIDVLPLSGTVQRMGVACD